MTRLACIIPVLGTTDGLEATLVSVLEHRPDDCEVVVALNVPYSDPYELAGEVRFLQAPRKANLVDCLNLGIGATRADVVHTLAAGYEVGDDWIDWARSHFDDPRVAAVAPAIYDAESRSQLLASGVGYRRGGAKTIARHAPVDARNTLSHIGPLLQAAFIRREALSGFGGLLPKTVGSDLADVDLALTWRAAGWRTQFASRCHVFAQNVELPPHGGLRSGMYGERLFWRHLTETGQLAGLVLHPIAVAQSIAASGWRMPLHALGRLLACCQFGSQRSYRQSLAATTCVAVDADDQEAFDATTDRREQRAGGTTLRIDASHPMSGRSETTEVRGGRVRQSR